ncbi:hypothetical protein quinque_005276 [Culex quinquefasciatus]
MKGPSNPLKSGVSGEPLFLSPYIEAKRIDQALNLSAVQHPLFQDIESYSGFITVDKPYNSNMFFWYVPAKNNRANAPVIVWLQGGPGASSLVGLFEEHGPFRVRGDLSVEKRLYSWHENHHMIYVDNPVGSGFSFTQNDYGYVTNEIEVGIHLYSFLTQFYSIFPLTLNPLYIAGESYGGKYLDVICAYAMAENFLRKLSFGGSEEYKNAVRQVYRVDGEVAGYLKRAGNLREMMIRNAGHMVPKDQPKWAFDIVSSFTHVAAVLLTSVIFVTVDASFINPYARFWKRHRGLSHASSGDNGEPLFVTPLLEAGKVKEAQEAARVNHSRIVGFESYTGFFTVDKRYNSNLFFWYFPAKNVTADTPVLLWLQGGPGASSLFGLFEENGPFFISKNLKAVPREFSWHHNHHLIYIDNPVGTGFSFTDSEDGYARNETQVGENLYQALVQFFQLFPQLQKNPFYASGESYGGKYVPAIGYTIHKKNPTAKIRINLQGLAIGNGYSDPLNQIDYGDYLFQLGLIDSNAKDRFDRDEADAMNCVRNNDYDCAFKIMDDLMDGDTDGTSFFKNISGFDTYYNYLHTAEDPTDEFYLAAFLKLPETRKALHVGDLPFHDLEQDNKVEKYLQHDILDSVAPWIVELLANYRMLIYNGQLDIICAYPMMVNYLKNLPFNGAAEYRTADRYIFYVDGEIAGYFKLVNNLLEVLIRDAGHMVPRDQPKWAYVMINTFTTVRAFDELN